MQDDNNLDSTNQAVHQTPHVIIEQSPEMLSTMPRQNPGTQGKSKKMLIIYVVIGILALTATLATYLIVFKAPKSNSDASAQPTVTATPTPTFDTTGWANYMDSTTNVLYSSPDWYGATVVAKYKIDEDIPSSLSSSISVHYFSDTKSWKTMESNASGSTSPRSDNLVSAASIKVKDTYPASFYTAVDGKKSQINILVVKDSDVYQFSLPATCDGIVCGSNGTWTAKKISDVVPAFISKITLP